jgi:hypothetical protein
MRAPFHSSPVRMSWVVAPSEAVSFVEGASSISGRPQRTQYAAPLSLDDAQCGHSHSLPPRRCAGLAVSTLAVSCGGGLAGSAGRTPGPASWSETSPRCGPAIPGEASPPGCGIPAGDVGSKTVGCVRFTRAGRRRERSCGNSTLGRGTYEPSVSRIHAYRTASAAKAAMTPTRSGSKNSGIWLR